MAIDHALKAWHEKQMAKGGEVKMQTGVTTPIGAPKLELISDAIVDAAMRLKISPEAARDLWIQGKIRLGGDVGKAEGGEISEEDLSEMSLDDLVGNTQYKEHLDWQKNASIRDLNRILDEYIQQYKAGKVSSEELTKFFPGYSAYDIDRMFGITSESEKKNPDVTNPAAKTKEIQRLIDLEETFRREEAEHLKKKRGYFPYQIDQRRGNEMFARGGQVQSRPCKDFDEQLGKMIDFHAKLGGLVQNYRKGGEVKMQGGGNPAQIQALLAEGVPVQMSRGPEGDIARRLIAEDEARRRKFEEEQAARVGAMSFPEKLRGGMETFQTIQSMLGRSMAAPFVALGQGEEAAKKFAEDITLPETEAGKYYLQQTGEALEPIGKAFEASKLPGGPFMPEMLPISSLPGLGRQVSGAVGQAARRADQIIPESLKNLPVGASTKSVGPEGEKVSVNELIRRLEAGEEMTPEQRQKAEYSKAQKEKYAQANIARAEKEPAPQAEMVKVPANEQGFYSSVEKALANIDRKEGSGTAFLSDIMKFEPSAGELEATGIVNLLKSKKHITKQDIIDYLDENKVQIEEVVRGQPLSKPELDQMEQLRKAISRGDVEVSQEELDRYNDLRQRYLEAPKPRFEDERLILPGGQNYKELLLKFPMPKREYGYEVFDPNTQMSKKFATEEEAKAFANLDKTGQSVLAKIEVGESKPMFTTGHWPDDPNTFAHVRMQDMDIGGKKTLVIEEIQSDWHQEGRVKGYKDPKQFIDYYDPTYVAARERSMELLNEFNRNNANPARQEEIRPLLDEARRAEEEIVVRRNKAIEGVPNAPFKKDWYQLAIKRLMRYAAENDYDQVALVGPNEQIRRGSLGTYVDGLTYEKNPDGTIKLIAERNGSIVLNETVEPENLELNVGKEVAKKILESKEADGTLTGDDLQIGGKGMRQYYDRNYPNYLEKQYGKYGVNLKKKELSFRGYGPDDVESEEVGEVDRFGRPVMGYSVRDPESGDIVGFGTSIDEALEEANRKNPKTEMWLMDLPAKLKTDIKIGQSYKKGGAVKKDQKLAQWYKEQQMARGGAIKKISEAAKKVGRMSREEAEKAGYWHPISETKLAKPITEYKATVVEDPGTKMTPRKSISIEELQGGVAIPLAGDRAAAGRIIKEIEGTPMDVRLEGGPDFMRLHPGAAWASGKGVLSMLADRIRMARESGQPIYGVYTAMSPQAVDFNTMMTESLLNQLDISDLRKKDIKEFNQAVKEVKGQGGKPKAPNFPGIDDPELREKLLTGPGGQRDAFVKAMAKAEFQKRGFPDVATARLAVTEPELLDVPRGTAGYTIAELDPEAKILEQSGHTTYPLDLAGQYAGGLERQLPVEVMYPTHFEAKRLMGSTPTGAHKSLELFAPLQYLDQNWLDNAMQYLEMQKKLTGRKKGGLAQARK